MTDAALATPVPPETAPRGGRAPWQRWPVGFPLVTAAVVLAAFDLWSARYYPPARRRFGVGTNPAPPVYGRFEPHFPAEALLAVALLAVGVAGAVWAARRTRLPTAPFLAAAVAFMVVFGAAVAYVDADPARIVDPLQRVAPPDYQPDVAIVRELGVRGAVEAYPDVASTLRSIHSKSHPPGPLVLLRALEVAFPGSLGARAAVIALLGALVLVPTWVIARRTAGARAARVAVLLLAVTPALLLFGWVSLDAVYATVMVTAAAVFVVAFDPDRPRPRVAVLAGAVTGLATFLTYAMSFVTMFAVLYAFLRLPARRAVRLLALAALGGVAALVLLRVAVGFDLFASYRASYEALLVYGNPRPYLYWLFGNPAVWLTFAGLPLAALGTTELLTRRPAAFVAIAAPLVVFYVLPFEVTHLIPGELERTLQFVYPFAAVAAGAYLVRHEGSRGAGTWLLGALVTIAGAQAILLEALYNFYW